MKKRGSKGSRGGEQPATHEKYSETKENEKQTQQNEEVTHTHTHTHTHGVNSVTEENAYDNQHFVTN